MKKQSAALCLLLLATCGCGGNDPDSLVTQQIGLLNEMADALESDAPQLELDEISAQMESLSKRIESLDLSTTEARELMERHKDELTKAATRLQQAMMKKAMNALGEGSFPGFPGGTPPGFGGN